MGNTAAAYQMAQPAFYESHREGLAELFAAMNVPSEAADSLPAAVEATQPWIRGDYSRPDFLFAIPADMDTRLFDLYKNFGLREPRPLPEDHYDDLWVMGAVQNGINRRLHFAEMSLRNPRVRTEHMTLVSGQRPPFPESEKEDIQANIESLRRKNTSDLWVQRVIEDSSRLTWETDLVRLAAADQLGRMALHRIDLRLGNADPIQAYGMSWQGIPVRITHSLAVRRAKGEPRPNTESTLQELLRNYPPVENARIGFIAANPHLERMRKSAQFVLRAEGRNDIRLIAAGPGATDKIGHPHYLAETAQNLYEDLRAQTL